MSGYAILYNKQQHELRQQKENQMKVERIRIDQIDAKENVREATSHRLTSLMSSIEQHSLLEPIGVHREKNGRYSIMYGNRRFAACFKLGWKTIPSILYTDQDAKNIHLKNMVENVQRENISPAELGRMCEKLTKLNPPMATGEIAARLNLPETTIKNVMSVYQQLPEIYRERVSFAHRKNVKGALTVTAANRILAVKAQLGLNKADVTRLLDHTQVDNLSHEDIKVTAMLMKGKTTIAEALEKRKAYKIYRVDVVALQDEIESLAAKADVSPINYLGQIIVGLQKPITKPSFVSLKK